MSKVYFIPLTGADSKAVQEASRKLLLTLCREEKRELASQVLLKVHFGEQGNRSYLKPELYDGIIDELESKGISASFAETSVLYGGARFSREKHLKLAESHGFTRLPVLIADGAHGEEDVQLPVPNGKHFQQASIAKGLAEAEQILVLSHFKGHMLAGFGGALKQLSMGFAAKGGKLAMHMSVKPRIINLLCRHCGLCEKRCNEHAITTARPKSRIDHNKCVGCGACFSICPHHAVSIFTFDGIFNALFRRNLFREKLAEYAAASHAAKKNNLYITFALNVTKGCDCEPHPMRNCVPDIGIFASTDPVAIDSAAWDSVAAKGVRFKGHDQLEYAEKLGMGSVRYELVTIA